MQPENNRILGHFIFSSFRKGELSFLEYKSSSTSKGQKSNLSFPEQLHKQGQLPVIRVSHFFQKIINCNDLHILDLDSEDVCVNKVVSTSVSIFTYDIPGTHNLRTL